MGSSQNGTSVNQIYTEDHQRLDELFDQFQKLKGSDRAKALCCFQEFKSGLERHIVWEEEILFPLFERNSGLVSGPTQVMRLEHREIRKYLDAIATKLAEDDYETQAEEASLNGVLGPHNYKEENILYPMIDQVTDAEERAAVFAKMN